MKKSIVILFSVIFLISLQLYGQTWSSLKRLTWMGRLYGPSIAADSGNGIHVVWTRSDLTIMNNDIFYKRSIDSGTTWSGPTRLTWTSKSRYPSIAADSSNGIHVVFIEKRPWEDSEIFYKLSTDGGLTWSGRTQLTWNRSSDHPSFAIDTGGGIHVVWDYVHYNRMFNLIGETLYKHSSDGGLTWSGRAQLAGPWDKDAIHSHHSYPSIAIDSGDGIHVMFRDVDSSYVSRFYMNSTDGGSSWSLPTLLIKYSYPFDQIPIVADSNNGLHIVWNGYDIYYKKRK